jgi:hypothetical protein
MKFNATRFARPLMIAAVPLLLVAGAAFAAGGGVPALVPDHAPSSAAVASAGASDKTMSSHVPELSESAEPSEGAEATHPPKAAESAEPSGDVDSHGDGDGDKDGTKDPSATAGATFGHHDGDGDGSGTKPTFGPSSSGAPSRDGGHH